MNIFLTSTNPVIAAKSLDDLRLNKMILETGQLLSQAYRHLFGEHELLYKNTHLNHPCAIWARANTDNYYWLLIYFHSLNQEKLARTNKQHKTFVNLFPILSKKAFNTFWWRVGDIFPNFYCRDKFFTYCENIKNFDFNCTNKKYLDLPITLQYQLYLCEKWIFDKKNPTWKGTEMPNFAKTYANEILRERV